MHSESHNKNQQESHHSFTIKPLQANHPIYMTTYSAERESGEQKISQKIDFKYIAIMFLGKTIVITLYFALSEYKLLDFIFVAILVSIDFWVNKNIFGKKLSGLRWWIELNQNSDQEEWVFESADPKVEINNINYIFFWITNLVTAAFWLINLIIITIITNALFWIGLCIFCLGMSLINLICFYKCRGKHQKKIQQMIQKIGYKTGTTLMNKEQNMNDQSHHEANFQIE